MRFLTYATAVVFLLGLLSLSHGQEQAKSPPLDGIWLGTLKVPGQNLRLAFHVKTKDGKLSATWDSLDQGADGLKVDEVTFKDGVVRFDIHMIKGGYEGKINEAGDEIVGEFKQTLKFPLVLKRVDKLPERKRPQEPKGPFPYLEEEITYENARDKVKFAGTLTLPKGDGPFPAVVMITGSGPQNRNEEVFGHKPFLLIADCLARRGIAVVRVDDRGVGGSTGGSVDTSTTAEFADDALAGVAFLKGRKEIDGKRIGLIGHSEGGVIAPLAASQSKDVAYIVLLAGTGLRGDEIIRRQSRLIAEVGGAKKKDLDLQEKYLNMLLPIIIEEADREKRDKRVKEQLAEWKEQAEGEAEKKDIAKLQDSFEKTHSKAFTNRWFRYFLAYDPAPALRKVQCPVLALNGEKDLQVPCAPNLHAIAEALLEGGNRDFTIRRFPNLNHLFQTCKTGSPSEYAAIEETMSPVVLDAIGDWIVAHTRK
jgi:uncharacterized protein